MLSRVGAQEDPARESGFRNGFRPLLLPAPVAHAEAGPCSVAAVGLLRLDFPVRTDLASPAKRPPFPTSFSPDRRQRRRLLPCPQRLHRFTQVLPDASSLLRATGHHRPDSLTPPLTRLAPRPLSHQ